MGLRRILLVLGLLPEEIIGFIDHGYGDSFGAGAKLVLGGGVEGITIRLQDPEQIVRLPHSDPSRIQFRFNSDSIHLSIPDAIIGTPR